MVEPRRRVLQRPDRPEIRRASRHEEHPQIAQISRRLEKRRELTIRENLCNLWIVIFLGNRQEDHPTVYWSAVCGQAIVLSLIFLS